MTELIATDNTALIVGGGLTGLSVARFLKRKGLRYRVYDTRSDESLLYPIKELDIQAHLYCGEYFPDLLNGISELILSPGVARSEQVVVEAQSKGIPVKSDIKLFLENANAPVVGITGSNGKSTVTTIIGLIAEQANLRAGIGGNLGVPALDLLEEPAEIYILELSSFQLESTDAAKLAVAINLNLSPDHLDRHGSMQAYFSAKQKIFHGAKKVVYNLGDLLTQPPIVGGIDRYGFGLNPVSEKKEIQFYLRQKDGMLMSNDTELMLASEIKQKGLHNVENILAAFAVAEALGISTACVEEVARSFSGLPHRCEIAAEINGVTYINDSKATNVGSTSAAIKGFANNSGALRLIAGGEGKGADFSDLADIIAESVSQLVLIGSDAPKIENALRGRVPCERVSDLGKAVEILAEDAVPGDIVLFSPACASFDMFKNFEHRGECFKNLVQELAA